jgi:YfiH family protein
VIIKPSLFDRLPINAFFTTKMSEHLDFLTSQTPDNKVYLPIQKHTDKVLVLDYDLEPKIADAVITNRKDILIGIQVADCVPLLLYDKKKNVIGAVHAGWRGTSEGILKKTIKAMSDRFYSSPTDVLIAMGPSIRWCCYGVGYEVIEAVCKATEVRKIRSSEDKRKEDNSYLLNSSTSQPLFCKKKGDKYCLDLSTANKYQALSLGIPLENIWMSNECTSCLPEKYYSYRYAKGTTGRQYGFIGIVI